MSKSTMYYKNNKPTSFMQMIKRRVIFLIEDNKYTLDSAIENTFFTFIQDIMTHPYYVAKGYDMDTIKKKFNTNIKMSFSHSKKFGQINCRKQGGLIKK